MTIDNCLSQVTEQWVQRYNGPGNSSDEARSIAVDGAGNVYVTGYSIGSVAFTDYATIKYNSAGVLQWSATYNGPGNSYDGAHSIAVDDLGNVYVTGESLGNGTNYDYATIKYNSAGLVQWLQRYNGTGLFDDKAYSIAVDGSGNVYVTGRSTGVLTNFDYATIKYNSAGVQQWVSRYNGPPGIINGSDEAYSIAIDGSGNVYVTGESFGGITDIDYATIKYNSSGFQQWVSRYNGPGNDNDYAYSIAVDGSGNLYVTGESAGNGTYLDYATIKYNNSSGFQQWVQRYNGPENWDDGAFSLAIDGFGNVSVTGYSTGSGTGYDYATIKYGIAGYLVWVQRYNGPGNSFDIAYSIAVDGSGNVYVTGGSYGIGTGYDYATIKYTTAGVQRWLQRYNGPGNGGDIANSIAVGGSGNVYMTGGSWGSGTNFDYATIKYIQSPNSPFNLAAIAVSSSWININWTDNSNNEVGFKIERSTNAGANWILKDSVGANIVTYADTGLTANTIYHYRVNAYNVAGNSPYSNVAFDTTFSSIGIHPISSEIPKDFSLSQNYPNPFNPVTSIKFGLPKESFTKLVLFDVLGREVTTLVNEQLQPGTYEVEWNGSNYTSGIYFYRIETENFVDSKKMILVK